MAYVLSAVIGSVPLLLVLIVGFVLVAQRRAQLGRRSVLFAQIGLGVLAADLVLQSIWTIVFPQLISSLDLRVASFGVAGFLVALILTIIMSTGVALLIAAIVTRAPGPRGEPPLPGAPHQPGYPPPETYRSSG